MARLVERLDSELPARGFRRVQPGELRTERWERSAPPVCAVSVRRAKKRRHVTVEAEVVGRFDVAPARAEDPDAVLGAVDAVLGIAWGGGRGEPAVVVTALDEAPPPSDPPAADAATVPVPLPAWAQLLETLEAQGRERAAALERAAVAETRLAALSEEAHRLRARADEADALAAGQEKALARAAELDAECDRLRAHVDLLWTELRRTRRRDPGFFAGLASLFRRR